MSTVYICAKLRTSFLMGSVICHIPSNGNSRVTFLLSIRCVQFGTRPIQRFYERRKFGFDPLSSNVNLTLEVGNHTQCSSSRPTLNCNQNDYGWRKTNSGTWCCLLQLAWYHRNLPFTKGGVILKSPQIEVYCELPSIWQELKSHQGELRTFCAMLSPLNFERVAGESLWPTPFWRQKIQLRNSIHDVYSHTQNRR